MVWATQKTSTQPRAFDEHFDIVHRFDTLAPENPNLHCEVHVGIKHAPQSLLSEAAAKYLDKLHQLPDRLLTKKMGTTALYRYCSTVLYIFSEEKMEKTG